eukprot:11226096-Lingulodinium_polyedra.AAC.1
MRRPPPRAGGARCGEGRGERGIEASRISNGVGFPEPAGAGEAKQRTMTMIPRAAANGKGGNVSAPQ